MNIIDLKKLNSISICDSDLFIVHDNIASETKALLSGDLANYILSSSNLYNSLKTGSFSGSFYGTLHGTSLTSSNSKYSLYSKDSNVLNYPNKSTSSFSIETSSSLRSSNSINSLTSSYASSSKNSISASYVNTYLVSNSENSFTSSVASASLYSNASDYIIYDGKDNGKVYKSIFSEYSPSASYAKRLSVNNTSKVSFSFTSSNSVQSNTADYINRVETAKFSDTVFQADNSIFSYCNFDVEYTINGYKFYVNQWKNLMNPGIGVGAGASDDNLIILTGSFSTPASKEYSTVCCDINVNFIPNAPIAYHFNSHAFPISSSGFAVALRVKKIEYNYGNPNIHKFINNANISVVCYAPSRNYPIQKPGIVISKNLISDCSKIG